MVPTSTAGGLVLRRAPLRRRFLVVFRRGENRVHAVERTEGPTMRRRWRIGWPRNLPLQINEILYIYIRLILWGSNWRYTPPEIPMWQDDIPCTKNGGTYFLPFWGWGFPCISLYIYSLYRFSDLHFCYLKCLVIIGIRLNIHQGTAISEKICSAWNSWTEGWAGGCGYNPIIILIMCIIKLKSNFSRFSWNWNIVHTTKGKEHQGTVSSKIPTKHHYV